MARSKFILAALVIATAAGPAAAAPTDADKATARTLFFSALEARKAGDHDKAADLFDRSNRLYPAPTAALGLARSLEATGKWVKATETFHRILRRTPDDDAPKAFDLARRAARKELNELQTRMPKLVIAVEGAAADAVVVTIDGAVVPAAALGVERPTDPGPHEVRVLGDGYVTVAREVELTEGQRLEVTLAVDEARPDEAEVEVARPAPAPIPRPSPPVLPPPEVASDGGSALRVSGFVIGAAGIGGFIGAAVTGGLYMSAEQTVQDECAPGPGGGGNLCSQAGLDAVDRGRGLEPINTALLAVGGVGVATGVALLIAGYVGSEEEVVVTPQVGPNEAGLGLRLRF